jgi:trehalose 6-phosphate synthase
MNLVAKEYVAAQSEVDPGVLVLSRFAGAAEALDAALIVNPYDIDETAEAIQRAVIMSFDERRDRWRRLFDKVRSEDIKAWYSTFLSALRTAEPQPNALIGPEAASKAPSSRKAPPKKRLSQRTH